MSKSEKKHSKISRDTTTAPILSVQKSADEAMDKRTVRLRTSASDYYRLLMFNSRVPLDSFLEAIAQFLPDNLDIEAKLIAIAKLIAQSRKDLGKQRRAETVAKSLGR